ncbi:hypothetical protein K493DRAFT_410661 [Basidiobolus meristosporus CBS 931.73]|uniref:G-protein coupled receptors family 2 profile 2 domain-containing protein n=1 Tax=Basidiobolus meristosporus CBS 931.73 TaxID=1314790 RepID=A0A1Y1XTG6_9FUNG|nr:hypothetical protein K493DRAFT_410661 [Basidiobolus meristosporus CBS 931.73]|eukprot:ORX89059.1 hypothetical protein K493DRAFT_410661 [Basidiobolus meristosporus CBS 931.73]
MASTINTNSWDYDPGYDLRLKGDFENNAVMIINVVLNSASILCGSLVLIIYFAIRSFEPKLMDRVSLRLTAAISAVDVLKAVVYILFTFVAVSGPACDFSAWAIIFLTNYYIFLTCMIAFNLQYVFLHNKPYHPSLERIYFIASFLLSVATTVPAWAAGRVGWDDNVGVCWWKNYSSKRTRAWEWGCFLFWVVACSIYCLVVVILVITKLEMNLRKLDRFNNAMPLGTHGSLEERRRKTHKTIKQLVARIALYTLIPIVTQGGFILMEIWLQFKHEMHPGINYWSVIGTDLPGILNLVAFLMDPALHNSVKVVRESLIAKYYHEESYQRTTMPLKNQPSYSTSSEPEYYVSTWTRFMRYFVRYFVGSKCDSTGSTFYRMSSNHNSSNTDRVCYTPTHLQVVNSNINGEPIEMNDLRDSPTWDQNSHTIGFLEADTALALQDQTRTTPKEEKEKLGKFIRGL